MRLPDFVNEVQTQDTSAFDKLAGRIANHGETASCADAGDEGHHFSFLMGSHIEASFPVMEPPAIIQVRLIGRCVLVLCALSSPGPKSPQHSEAKARIRSAGPSKGQLEVDPIIETTIGHF